MAPVPATRRIRVSLAHLHAIRGIVLQRLSQPLRPALRRMEHDHLGRLERAICDAEAGEARLDVRLTPAEHRRAPLVVPRPGG